MQLTDLARELGTRTGAQAQITGVTHNSQWVQPGCAYVALKGAKHDGHAFLADAVARGAVAVIGEGLPDGVTSPVPYLQVAHGRVALAAAAAAVHGHPSRDLTVIGVTGTDGKTTTSLLALHLLRTAGLAAGLVSTIGYQLPDGVMRQTPAHFTTPEAPQVQQILADLRDARADVCVLESSSHALALERVGAVDYDVALWTHLSSEHLDFHGTLENYFADKAKLVQRARHAVLNADDPWTERLRGVAPTEVTYSTRGADADWRATGITETDGHLGFTLTGPAGSAEITLPMLGTFNVANATAAAAAVQHVGASLDAITEGLRTFGGVPGRMQFVPLPDGVDGPRVVVDFAHTPDSLEKALTALRATTRGRLWCVIGAAGGARDTSRIEPMGRNVAAHADVTVLTEDDSYDTPLAYLLGELERGARSVDGAAVEVIEDRREALRHVLTSADSADTVLLAGKGAEDFLGRPGGSIAWDEAAEAAAVLATRAG